MRGASNNGVKNPSIEYWLQAQQENKRLILTGSGIVLHSLIFRYNGYWDGEFNEFIVRLQRNQCNYTGASIYQFCKKLDESGLVNLRKEGNRIVKIDCKVKGGEKDDFYRRLGF